MMDLLKESSSLLEENIAIHLRQNSPHHEFTEMLEYAVLPAGKLFRPKLALAKVADILGPEKTLKLLQNPQSPLSLTLSSLEIHHAYTLVHDDLPCMDDDDERRGRPSLHKKYGQWQAVLAGDALLHMSHSLLEKTDSATKSLLPKIFNWALGAKGLILGQVYDLEGTINKDFPSLLRTHTLKTGRLIQTSLCAGSILANKSDYRTLITNLKLGEALGICFQLLDDLSEGTEKLNTHEIEVNPFLKFPKLAFDELEIKLNTIQRQTNNQNNPFLLMALDGYFKKMGKIIEEDLRKEDSLLIEYFGKHYEMKNFDLLVNNFLK